MEKIYKDIASIHTSSITTGFLSMIGERFLALLYKAIDKCPYSRVIYKLNNKNEIIGFVSGTISVKKMYKWIVSRYGIVFFVQLIPFVFKLYFLKRILETLFYTFKKKSEGLHSEKHPDCDSELLSMAVSEDQRECGVGSKLVSEMDNYFIGKGVFEYKVVTFSEDKRSNCFYQKNGFILRDSYKHHNNLLNEYIKKGLKSI